MSSFTRRQAVIGGIAGAAALAAVGREGEGAGGGAPGRLPVVYLPHGGGPWPFVDVGFGERRELDALAAYLRGLRAIGAGTVRAVLAVSAHWEEQVPTVMTAARPPMLYDYYGFPPESYQIQWPAPGDPGLAARVRELLGKAGIRSGEDSGRGFDHGTFVPLKLTYPDANVPTIQLSLKAGLDPTEHLAIGRAVAPLRDEGVLIVGSGMSFHNLRGFGDPRSVDVAAAFDAWLCESTVLPPAGRNQRLAAWQEAPMARQAHPREEHLLPLMVVAGAAGEDRGVPGWQGTLLGRRISAHHFGA